MKKSEKKIFVVLSAVMFLMAGVTVSAQNTWYPPAGNPPGNNVESPINTGMATQYKEGVLGAGKIYADKEAHSWDLSALGKTIIGSFRASSGKVIGKKKDGSEKDLAALAAENGAELYVLADERVDGESIVRGRYDAKNTEVGSNIAVNGELSVSGDLVVESLKGNGVMGICTDSNGNLMICETDDVIEEEPSMTAQEHLMRYLGSQVVYRFSAPGGQEQVDYFDGNKRIAATAECQHNPSEGVYEVLIGGGGSCGGAKSTEFGELNRSHPMSSGFHNIFSDRYLSEVTDVDKFCSGFTPTYRSACRKLVEKYPLLPVVDKELAVQGIVNPWPYSPVVPWSFVPGYSTPDDFDNDMGQGMVDQVKGSAGLIDTWYVQCDATKSNTAMAYAYAICLPVQLD